MSIFLMSDREKQINKFAIKQQMQTSSNFFNKNLLTIDDDLQRLKRSSKYQESHILQDPLGLKEELTPWTEINPTYNFKTQRLIRFKQKIIHQSPPHTIVEEQTIEDKEGKEDVVSNLFNFYKKDKEIKRVVLNNVKRKSRNSPKSHEQDKSWTLPLINYKEESEKGKTNSKQALNKNIQKKESPEKQNQKPKGPPYIQSISIREYLTRLKEKQKVFSSPPDTQQKSSSNSNEKDHFTSNRYKEKKSKKQLQNSISMIRENVQADLSYRYASTNNSQSYIPKKRSNMSHFQSLDQSFEIYKRAVEMEVEGKIGFRRQINRSQRNIDFSLAQRNLFKSNIPLNSLFSSSNDGIAKISAVKNNLSSVKKFNTISYDRSFSLNGQNSLSLPKVNKNVSYPK